VEARREGLLWLTETRDAASRATAACNGTLLQY